LIIATKINLQWYLQEPVILNINLFNFVGTYLTFKPLKNIWDFDFMTEDIAIDLGTANTLIIHNDKVVIDSPSIVARDRISGKIIAVGKEANLMQGKTHENIKTIRP
jgi:hypothetical protein